MKKSIVAFVALFFSLNVFSQTLIKAEEVGKHVGDSVVVEARVFSTRYFESAKNTPTLLNIGAAFPNQLFTVVIYGEDRKNFSTAPEEYFKNQTVKIRGKVELYRDRPQIVVKNSEGIQVIQEGTKQ